MSEWSTHFRNTAQHMVNAQGGLAVTLGVTAHEARKEVYGLASVASSFSTRPRKT